MSYCTAQDVYSLFGRSNVDKWADLENTRVRSEMDARIAVAIAWASEEVDDKLRGGPYLLPVGTGSGVPPSGSFPVPKTIMDVAARLAGVWLYEARGIEDVDAEGRALHKMSWHKNRAYQVLAEVRNGTRRLAITALTTFPEAVSMDDEEEETASA